MPRIHLIFDFIIYSGLTASLLVSLYIFRGLKKRKIVKFKKIATGFLMLSILSFVTIFYGSFVEPNIIIEKHAALDLPNIDGPLTIALIADYQVGPYRRVDFVKRSVEKIIKTKPDVVLIAGDLIDNNGSSYDELSYLAPLKKLATQIPTYAVHGNHEHGAMSINKLAPRFEDMTAETKEVAQNLGITYLVDELALVEIRGQRLHIYGSDDWWGADTKFDELEKRETGIPTIVMNHNPAAIVEAQKFDIDFFVAGHTHGGQVRLPFMGALYRVDTSFPRAWDKGFYEYNGLKAYTTSGLGESITRARLFNLPEIVYFEVE